MREKMRVLHAEAGEDDGALVGFAVAVGVFEKGDVVAVLDVAAVFVRQHAERDGEALGEDARLAREAGGRLRVAVEDEHFVLGLARVERIGGGGVFVAIDGVFERGRGPQRAVLVEGERDEFADAIGDVLAGDELDFKTRRQRERSFFFLG